MNKQHDLNIYLNSIIKTPLKPLLFASCMLLTLSYSFADETSREVLNELSEEASHTEMTNDQSKAKTTEDPTASVKVNEKEVAGDELSEKIENQLRQVLGKTDTDTDTNSSDGKKDSTEAELEKIVSSSLLEGARMEDIRSAVGEAMSAIEKEKDNKKAIAPERITKANKAFSKLTITQKPATEKAEDKAEAESKPTTNSEKTAEPEIVVSSGTVPPPETVIVQEGESLFRIALRVYGDGNKYYKLYKANEDRIKDPNLLLAGQELVTPEF